MQALQDIQHFRPSGLCKQRGLKKHPSLWTHISTPGGSNGNPSLNPKGLFIIPPLLFGCTYLIHTGLTQQVRGTSGAHTGMSHNHLHIYDLSPESQFKKLHVQALTLSSHWLCHVCTIHNACTNSQPVAALMTADGGEITKKTAFSLSASSSSFQVGCREAEHGFTSQTNSNCNNKTL